MEKIYNNANGSAEIKISEDSFSAFLTINDDGVLQNENDLLSLIEESGITWGFENAALYNEENGIRKKTGEPFLIALGDKFDEPEAEFNPLFNPEESFNPSSFANRFHLLKDFDFAEKDSALAQLFITKSGITGRNVYGTEISPEFSDEEILKKHLGENVFYSEEKSMIMAAKAGYPYLDEEGKVNVKSDFEINENIGLNFDNFGLRGNLTVNGNVSEKIKMKIDGNLTVNGDINDADIEISGQVSINGDIMNCKETGIVAQGNVSFNSAESARVVTAGQIYFEDNAHFCRLIAEKGIYGSEKGSAIVGGLIQSGEHIEAAVIGNPGAIGTETEITISPFIKEKMLVLNKESVKLRDHPEHRERMAFLTAEMEKLAEKYEEAINKALLPDQQIPRHITVFKKIFGGTYLRILKKSITVSEELERVSFSIVNGEFFTDEFN
ncbi:MAG: hypothetical protein CSB55_02865 [Candidatus Cloacimonadota bacterium]|nr:MAG: hypothetical protein CSB55_02865 [Candidatus Cloacimonadota bacterium]